MSREIRVTVDDDEVFERMKRRKRELDLSWEEVLHRGLRPESTSAGRERGPGPGFDPGPGSDFDPDPGRERHHGSERRRGGRRSGDRGRGERDRWDAFAQDLEEQIQSKVYDTLQSSFGAAGIDVPDYADDDIDQLERAEDATLAFEFLDDQPEYRVPLRVNLHTGRDGLTVEVVAVRQGKGVRDHNRFDGGARKRVNQQLAAGDDAVLRFAEGAETYRVRPVLSWGRDDDGRPTVTDVEIDEVRFDDD